MKTADHIIINAPTEKVYQAAQAILDWPRLLPHYRWVKVFEERGNLRQVEMAAHRDGIPCKWRSEQRLYPKEKKIYYRHTWGWSKGMEVWWLLRRLSLQSCEVRLTHDLPKPLLLDRLFYGPVVGHFFVDSIAGKTLAGLKKQLESGLEPHR